VNVTIARHYGDYATTGTMQVGDASFFTIERPWMDNESGTSCVPEGTYQLIPYLSPKHGQTWCLENEALGVTADGHGGTRSRCEIHSANWATQLEGCIALGLRGQPMYNPDTGRVEPAVEDSKDAVAHFNTLLGPMSTGHTLTITRA
jgi:hypothetical protein